MSDSATDQVAVAPAPIAPAPTAAPAAPMAMTRMEARSSLRDPVVAPPAPPAPAGEPTVDATGRLHAPDNGKFVNKPADGQDPNTGAADAPSPTEPVAAEAPAPAPTPADAATAATEKVPEGYVRVELKADHPLRARGRTHVLAPADAVEDYQGFLDTPVRREEVRAARTAVLEREQALDEHVAALKAANEFNALLFRNKEITKTYWSMEEDYGTEAANGWLQDLVNKHGENIEQYVSEAQQERQEGQHRQAAQVFLQEAVSEKGRSLFRHWNDQEYTRALRGFAAFAQAEGLPELTLADFKDYADPIYARHPKVQELIRQARTRREQENGRVAGERENGAAAERATLARARDAASDIPLSGAGAVVGTGREPPAPAAPALSYKDAKRALRTA